MTMAAVRKPSKSAANADGTWIAANLRHEEPSHQTMKLCFLPMATTALFAFVPRASVLFVSEAVVAGAILGFASSARGQDLFEADHNSGNIYEFAPDATRTTFASGFTRPMALTFDSSGNLYVASASPGQGFAPGYITEIAAGGGQSIFASGMGVSNVLGMAFDSAGNLFAVNEGTSGVGGFITEIAPGGAQSTFATEPGQLWGAAFDSAGNLFVAGYQAGDIYEFTPTGTQSIFASGLSHPEALAFNGADDLFVLGGNKILEFTSDGTQSTFASGISGSGMACDTSGDLYVGEINSIIKITPEGVQSTFATGLNNAFALAFDVPEPSSAGLLLFGGGILLFARRKTQKQFKRTLAVLVSILSFAAATTYGQDFVYDQQITQSPRGATSANTIQSEQPIGQSFTPSFSNIDFVMLDLADRNPGNNLGATLYVNLWSGSISNGTLLASTTPVFMPDGFGDFALGVTNFIFPTTVSLTPGTTYYLQPYVQSGDGWVVDGYHYPYSGGNEYINGLLQPGENLWFSEGVIDAPEPSSAGLLLLGGGILLFARRKTRKYFGRVFALLLAAFSFAAATAYSQGLTYDQQVTASPQGTSSPNTLQGYQPLGQSFTPSLSGIDFVMLSTADFTSGNNLGATLYVNLWSGSISNGTLLASTEPVFLPDGFGDFAIGVTNFYFPTTVSLTPGTTYYLQPYVQSGDNWRIDAYNYNYSGGALYLNGNIQPNDDMWFREGIIDAPEPSSAGLLLLGGGILFFVRRKRAKIPTGFHHPAQGCEERATLGVVQTNYQH